MVNSLRSIGCGKTKDSLSPTAYAALEEALVEKDKAERDLRTYTNLVGSCLTVLSIF